MNDIDYGKTFCSCEPTQNSHQPLVYTLLRAANQSNSMIGLIEGGHRLREQLWCGIYRCEVSYGVRLVESAIGLILLE